MYNPNIVEPMRKELTDLGINELKTADEVKQALEESKETTLLVVNSVCGCAAGALRPAVKLALSNTNKPGRMFTVFAGQDKEATAAARSYLVGYPPSSPSLAILKNGDVVRMIHRHDIEGFSAAQIAEQIVQAFNEHC